ncbi:MAG: DUF1318 domain-containing protein [Candidatus Aminicenantes bacterium]|nr:DUF1318 domain-containing protein [Candidatus Aminicenantes bacterium]
MKRRSAYFVPLAAAMAFVFSCITVNIYFPEATVRTAAEEIVQEIRKKDGQDKAGLEAVGAPARGPAAPFSLVPAAWAQEETTVSNPAIRALKETLKNRFPALKPFFAGGNIGETNKGLLEVRDEASLGLKEKAALRSLVKDENGDRTKLYAEVAKALNIEAGQIERVQKIFAESWIKSAEPGWWVQNESGDWVKKS